MFQNPFVGFRHDVFGGGLGLPWQHAQWGVPTYNMQVLNPVNFAQTPHYGVNPIGLTQTPQFHVNPIGFVQMPHYGINTGGCLPGTQYGVNPINYVPNLQYGLGSFNCLTNPQVGINSIGLGNTTSYGFNPFQTLSNYVPFGQYGSYTQQGYGIPCNIGYGHGVTGQWVNFPGQQTTNLNPNFWACR